MFTHDDIITAIGARANGTLALANGVSTDSRTVQRDDLFIALRGAAFDGHRYVADVERKGAAGIVVNYALDVHIPQYIVDDTLAAFHAIAAYHRCRFSIPVVAITGTNGKTTVKEMTAQILAQRGLPLYSEKNFNNHIGVPTTILRMARQHTHAVIEMGMNHPGEIRMLSSTAAPTVAVITNAGHGHLEFLGTVDDVVKAKLEILDGLAGGGTAVLPADGPHAAAMREAASRRGCTVMTFGLSPRADVTFAPAVVSLQGLSGTLRTPVGETQITMNLTGVHNGVNAAAAVAAALAADHMVSIANIAKALDGFKPVNMRCQIETIGGADIIADCYNANLDSVRAGLDLLASVGRARRRIVLLGEMAELGATAADCHYQAGLAAGGTDPVILAVVGPTSAHVLRGARDAGMPGTRLHAFADIAAASAFLNDLIQPGDCVLVKGSRTMRMENALNYWRQSRSGHAA